MEGAQLKKCCAPCLFSAGSVTDTHSPHPPTDNPLAQSLAPRACHLHARPSGFKGLSLGMSVSPWEALHHFDSMTLPHVATHRAAPGFRGGDNSNDDGGGSDDGMPFSCLPSASESGSASPGGPGCDGSWSHSPRGKRKRGKVAPRCPCGFNFCLGQDLEAPVLLPGSAFIKDLLLYGGWVGSKSAQGRRGLRSVAAGSGPTKWSDKAYWSEHRLRETIASMARDYPKMSWSTKAVDALVADTMAFVAVTKRLILTSTVEEGRGGAPVTLPEAIVKAAAEKGFGRHHFWSDAFAPTKPGIGLPRCPRLKRKEVLEKGARVIAPICLARFGEPTPASLRGVDEAELSRERRAKRGEKGAQRKGPQLAAYTAESARRLLPRDCCPESAQKAFAAVAAEAAGQVQDAIRSGRFGASSAVALAAEPGVVGVLGQGGRQLLLLTYHGDALQFKVAPSACGLEARRFLKQRLARRLGRVECETSTLKRPFTNVVAHSPEKAVKAKRRDAVEVKRLRKTNAALVAKMEMTRCIESESMQESTSVRACAFTPHSVAPD